MFEPHAIADVREKRRLIDNDPSRSEREVKRKRTVGVDLLVVGMVPRQQISRENGVVFYTECTMTLFCR